MPVQGEAATNNEGYAMNTSEVLHKAADLIEERGHRIGGGWPGAENDDGRLCLEGGIMAALGFRWDEGSGVIGLYTCPAFSAVRSYLTGPENPAGKSPFVWQDHLKYDQDADGNVLFTWVGGSSESGEAYAKARVIEVLRAAAAIEAAREAAGVAAQVSA